jgi:hypothetical protein
MPRRFTSGLTLALFGLAGLGIGCGAAPAEPVTPTSAVLEGPATRPAAAPATFAWAKPQGWKSETIPFPLEFAPELSYRGVEELRFGPRFFDPASETYFSYSFAWMLDGAPSALTGEQLSADLAVYFRGLAHAVNAERFDPSRHAASIAMTSSGRSDAHYKGRVTTVDAFGDGRSLELIVDGETFTCGSRRVVLLTLAPRGVDDAVWAKLLRQRGTFQCTST